MLKVVTLTGDHIEDSTEFKELEMARDVQLACWEFEQRLRNLWKHGVNEDWSKEKLIDEIWEYWYDCTSGVREVIG